MKKFAVLGYPIGHSMSPLLHNEIFRMKGLAHSYEAVLMPPEQLEGEFPSLKDKFAGFNCTIPLKEKVIPLIDSLSSHARELGSVNTVKCDNGITYGTSTDTEGFLRSLSAHNVSLKGKTVLIVGCGGVARVIAIACAREGCNITIALRSPEKALTLIKEIDSLCGVTPTATALSSITGSFDLLVQCTPVGMYPNISSCPVSDEVIKNCHAVFDTVYNPIKTLILQKAELFGKTAIGGLEMLVYQGLASEEVWLGLTFTKEESDHLISLLEEKLKEGTK